ncbi:MAG: GNAT family N-acetyltransferase [Caldilinea sp.]
MHELVAAEVHMIRSTMENLPTWRLPDGYRFRPYREGDIDVWLALHLDAEPLFRIEKQHFDRSFGAHREALLDRMFFVQTADGEDVGTITAWWEDDWDRRGAWGRIHWVVVATAHQRRGLAKPMTAHALHRIAQGHSRAMLGTDTRRLWAIKTYLDCGFVPDPAERGLQQAVLGWSAVQRILRHPAIAQWLAGKFSEARPSQQEQALSRQ